MDKQIPPKNSLHQMSFFWKNVMQTKKQTEYTRKKNFSNCKPSRYTSATAIERCIHW